MTAADKLNLELTNRDIARANREHDQRYGWSPRWPTLYNNTHRPAWAVSCPNLDKNLTNQVLDKLVWNWHTRTTPA